MLQSYALFLRCKHEKTCLITCVFAHNRTIHTTSTSFFLNFVHCVKNSILFFLFSVLFVCIIFPLFLYVIHHPSSYLKMIRIYKDSIRMAVLPLGGVRGVLHFLMVHEKTIR